MKAVVASLPGGWVPRAREALFEHWAPYDIHYHEIEPGDETGYPRLLAEHWEQKQDFAVIEPDIVITRQVTSDFHSCPEWYCAFPYPWLTDIGPALGCTRFRAEIQAAHPDVFNNVLRNNVSWRQTDVVLMRHELARARGIQPHVHLPPVEHLNEKKRLLPEAPRTIMMEVPHW